eukprot:1143763-Pelagomonas_calceolata.AAC.2
MPPVENIDVLYISGSIRSGMEGVEGELVASALGWGLNGPDLGALGRGRRCLGWRMPGGLGMWEEGYCIAVVKSGKSGAWVMSACWVARCGETEFAGYVCFKYLDCWVEY